MTQDTLSTKHDFCLQVYENFYNSFIFYESIRWLFLISLFFETFLLLTAQTVDPVLVPHPTRTFTVGKQHSRTPLWLIAQVVDVKTLLTH